MFPAASDVFTAADADGRSDSDVHFPGRFDLTEIQYFQSK
jgi:hypothetical protein